MHIYHNRNQNHTETPPKQPKTTSFTAFSNKYHLILLSCAKNRSDGGGSFTPRVGHLAPDSYQNLVPMHQSERSKTPILPLFGAFIGFCVATVSLFWASPEFFLKISQSWPMFQPYVSRATVVRDLSDCQSTSQSSPSMAMMTPVSSFLSAACVVTKVPITACADVSTGWVGAMGFGAAAVVRLAENHARRRLTASPLRACIGSFVGVEGAAGEFDMPARAN